MRPISPPNHSNPSLSTQSELSINHNELSKILKTDWVKSTQSLKENESL
jgi:hypothetical protein